MWTPSTQPAGSQATMHMRLVAVGLSSRGSGVARRGSLAEVLLHSVLPMEALLVLCSTAGTEV